MYVRVLVVMFLLLVFVCVCVVFDVIGVCIRFVCVACLCSFLMFGCCWCVFVLCLSCVFVCVCELVLIR